MGWTPTPTGSLHCTTHGETFAQGKTCFACARSARVEDAAAGPGPMERACVEAAGRGLMSLLDVETKVVGRAEQADDFAKVFADKANECIKLGDVEGAVLFANAGVKWFGEGTKGWRAVKEMTSERYRRAEIEKTKRLLDRVRNGQKGSN